MLIRVSILGASGSIGRAVVRELHSRGVTTRAVTRWSSQPPDVETERAIVDLDSAQSVHDSLAGSNSVIFCVSPLETDPLEYARIKLGHLRRVLDACRDHKVDRFVLVSAADTAADEHGLVDASEHHVPGGRFDFTDARYHCESEVALRAADGMNASFVLPFICAGPGTSARARQPEGESIFVSELEKVAKTVAEESLGREIGLRRVVVDGRLAQGHELDFEPEDTRRSKAFWRFSDARVTRRDDALLDIRPRPEESAEKQ